jgi:hypothetical protein
MTTSRIPLHPRIIAIHLTGGKVLNEPPTPPLTPTIASTTKYLRDMTRTELISEMNGVTTESTEVPEHLISSFFWLQDKLEIWAKSDFGGSLVGFFTRVKMQVSLHLITIIERS